MSHLSLSFRYDLLEELSFSVASQFVALKIECEDSGIDYDSKI